MSGKYANGVAFFQALISSNNSVRAEAEKDLKTLKESNPSLLFSYCLETLSHTEVSVVQMALFVIKREFVLEKDQVPAEYKEQLGSTILALIQKHGVKVLMNIGAEILCGIAAHSKNYQGFLQQLVQICQSPDSKLRMFGLIAFETMTGGHLETEMLESYASNFLTVFTGLLTDSEIQVRMQAVKTISTFLSSISNADLLMKMGGVLSNLITTMIEALNYDEDEGKLALEALTTLTELQPNIWNKYLSDIVVVCSQIVTATKFKEETRAEAIELVLAIADLKKSEIRKLAEIKTMFFPALVQMMTEVDHKDNIAAWTQDEEDEMSKVDPASTASSAISRLSEVLGGKATIALTDTHIMNYMKSPEWTYRYAGILCIGMIAENCKDIMMKESTMQTLLYSLLPFLEDSHIRVKHAAITSIALLCTELAPEIQKKHHKVIIENMWKLMDHENIKLRSQAVSCLVNFCKGVMDGNEQILEPYAGTLLEKLAKLFEQSLSQNYMPLQSEVLSCMSMIATVIRDKFAQYYSTFIPGLKNLLANTPMTTLKQKELRANTIKTIGNMLYAVADIKENKEVVIKDAKEFTDGLIALLDSKLSDDDPQGMAIYNFWGEVTYVLGEGFGEYLPRVLPPLFGFAKADTNVKITDSQNPVKDYGVSDMVLSLGGVNLSVNTQAFQSKVMAANVLLEICSNTKRAFRPYIEEMVQIVISLLNCAASGTLKRTGAKCFKGLLITCETKEEMVKVFNYVYPTLRKTLLSEIESELYRDIKCYLKELCNAMRLFSNGPQMLSLEGMADLCDVLSKALECYGKLHKEKMESLRKGKDLDEEEIEEIEDEIDNQGKIVTHVMEIAGIIGKLYGVQCEGPFMSKLIPHYVNFWETAGNSTRLQLAAICFFCDTIEYLHDASFHSEIAKQVGKKYVAAMSSSDRDIIQSAAYGLGLIAQHAPAQFKEILPSALECLARVVQEPDSRSEEKAVATECAIGALGKVALFHFDNGVVGPSLVQQYLSMLPLKAESEEAQNVHALLFREILARNAALQTSVEQVKAALERIHATATAEPGLEIIKSEDAPVIQQCAAVLAGAK